MTLVAVADRKFDREGLYDDVVADHGGAISYHKYATEREVIDRCADAEVLLTFKAPITPAVFEALDGLRAVIRLGTGFDNVNVKAATEHGVVVANTPGYSRHEVATHAITLMLATAREVPLLDREMRETNGWDGRNKINRMYGGTFGIVGLGRIGRAAVPKAKGFDMDVVAYDPYVSDDIFSHVGVEKVGFLDLLRRADCVSVHAPLTSETHHLVSTDELEAMQPSSILINTARGPIVDEQALVNAVESGEVWGAGLDVFETEPPVDSPLLESDRIVCSPHHAGRCDEAHEKHVEVIREELARALAGEHLEHVVNPEVLQYSNALLSPEH